MIVERNSIPPIHQRKFLIGRKLIAPSPKRPHFPDQRLPSLETFPCSSHYFRDDHIRIRRTSSDEAHGFGDLLASSADVLVTHATQLNLPHAELPGSHFSGRFRNPA